MKEKVSPYIRSILEDRKPVCTFTKEQETLHRLGLSAIGLLLHPDFFDFPVLPPDRFSQEGYFHTIEYLSGSAFFTDNDAKTQLATVYHIYRDQTTGNLVSHCPLNIMIKVSGINTWSIYVLDNTGVRTITRVLLTNVEDSCTTDYPNYKDLRLSSLFSTTLN